jgi:predicted ferric reductase
MRNNSVTLTDQLRDLGRSAIGRRRDWSVPRPRLSAFPKAGWIGSAMVLASVLVGWFAFAGAQGEEGGSVALGLFVGAASIVLMAWSFILAVRIRWLEPLFGGLDRMYQVHRWAGALAVPTMFLHVRLEPEVEGGIAGASRAVAESAEGLAGVGEYMIYALIVLSFVRWIPWRFWRMTHKLFGIPFAFASWHFFTAEKPYANNSAWGWYFGAIMVAGLVTYLYRVVVRDMLFRGRSYTVANTVVRGSTLELELAPNRRKLAHHAGQFVVLKIQERGLSEPHVFTIASSPDAENLRFYIRDLGDWTHKLLQRDLVGTKVIVEGPYGHFAPFGSKSNRALWIAGGVGITPFLSAIDSLKPAPSGQRPTLVYCVRHREDATAIERLEQAAEAGCIDLHILASSTGDRFSTDRLAELVDGASLKGVHTAVCGPAGLVSDAAAAARRLGAGHVETEAFDFRSGIGPDLSRPIDEMLGSAIGRQPVPQPS